MEPLEPARQYARECSIEHPDDIDAAVECLRNKIGAKAEKAIAEILIVRAYREIIHEARHEQNVRLRRESGQYGGTAKITAGDAVMSVASESLLNSYFIAGRSLGAITGSEIPELIASENAKADGALFNATLLSRLQGRVTSDKTVRECLTETQVARVFRSIKKQGGSSAA